MLTPSRGSIPVKEYVCVHLKTTGSRCRSPSLTAFDRKGCLPARSSASPRKKPLDDGRDLGTTSSRQPSLAASCELEWMSFVSRCCCCCLAPWESTSFSATLRKP